MASNRYTRDQILTNALDLADSAVLDAHERPAGTIVDPGAFSIKWLQEALDFFHKKFPYQAVLKNTPITITPVNQAMSTISLSLLGDYILDYKNGIVLTPIGNSDVGRIQRRGLSFLLNLPLTGGGDKPAMYSIANNTIFIWPPVDKVYSATLWYYGLPPALTATQIPLFPDDFILTQYIWIKAQEYHRVAKPGDALAFADARAKELIAAGIGMEAEEDQFEIDRQFAQERPVDPNSWMGKPVAT